MARKVETDIRCERKKDCMEKLLRFPQQQYNLGLEDHQSCQDSEPLNILNLDELGLFLKDLLERHLMEKGKKTKGGKKSKQCMTAMFIAAFDGSLVF